MEYAVRRQSAGGHCRGRNSSRETKTGETGRQQRSGGALTASHQEFAAADFAANDFRGAKITQIATVPWPVQRNTPLIVTRSTEI